MKLPEVFTKEDQNQVSPADALQLLKEGNERFTSKQYIKRDLHAQVAGTTSQQSPFAVILSCIDSRVPVEAIFDLGIGDVFSARVAGNFVNVDMLGSIEYACKVAGSKLVLVLGHEGCGAIKGACDHVKLGNITPMLDKLMPAVDSVEENGDRSSGNAEFVHKVVAKNVSLTVDNIRKQSAVLKEMEDAGEIKIVGGVYDITTGKVGNFVD